MSASNQWGWGGFTTRDLKRCRLMAGSALVFNWWSLFVSLADPNHHREANTSRPLLLQAIGRQTSHAGRTTVTVTSSHRNQNQARRALTRIAAFFCELRKTAEQLTVLERNRPNGTDHPETNGTSFTFLGFTHVWGWYRILSQALVKLPSRTKTGPTTLAPTSRRSQLQLNVPFVPPTSVNPTHGFRMSLISELLT
jgi:hypothetical protein